MEYHNCNGCGRKTKSFAQCYNMNTKLKNVVGIDHPTCSSCKKSKPIVAFKFSTQRNKHAVRRICKPCKDAQSNTENSIPFTYLE